MTRAGSTARQCDNCHERKPGHYFPDRQLCCVCHVVAGNPPADWHRYCMEAVRWLADLRMEARL